MSEKLASRKSVVVSEAVQRRVKARAAELGRSVKAVVEEALTVWLRERERDQVAVEAVAALEQTLLINRNSGARWRPPASQM